MYVHSLFVRIQNEIISYKYLFKSKSEPFLYSFGSTITTIDNIVPMDPSVYSSVFTVLTIFFFFLLQLCCDNSEGQTLGNMLYNNVARLVHKLI